MSRVISGGSLWEEKEYCEEIEGIVVSVRDRSIEFMDDVSGQTAFIPFSAVRDWRFVDRQDKKGLNLHDLLVDDEISVDIPKWLARKEFGR